MISMIDNAVLAIDPVHPDLTAIARAADVLRAGLLVVAPTETRYGLLARADSDATIHNVFEAKGRQPLQPTALFVRGESELDEYGEMTPSAKVLSQQFLPGPLTLVLRSRKLWEPPRVVDGLIGLRWSSSPVIAELIRLVDFPVTATSANLSASPELETIDQIREALGSHPSLYLEAGRLNRPVSTVVKCVGDEVTILRERAIDSGAIYTHLKNRGLR